VAYLKTISDKGFKAHFIVSVVIFLLSVCYNVTILVVVLVNSRELVESR
jgi:hypothetical protein